MEIKPLDDLVKKFAEKNASLIREIMECHFVRFKDLEFSQGVMIKGEVDSKKYKNIT